jgi:tetratricopeptide (TPR) repeat protein
MRHLFPFLAAIVLIACGGCAVTEAGKALRDAQRLAAQGKYEEALQKHIWYHGHALEDSPSHYGVRLSFALSYWVELGEKYPKAREALEAIRDRDAQKLGNGEGDRDLFNDVQSINEHLEEIGKTVELFKHLHETRPDFAAECYDIAAEDLVAQQEYAICSSYVKDSTEEFQHIVEAYVEVGVLDKAMGLANFNKREFVHKTALLVEILAGAGRMDEAERVRAQALAVRDDPEMRDALSKAIERLSNGSDGTPDVPSRT